MLDRLLNDLLSRESPDGNFPENPGGVHRPDASAWAAIALSGTPAEKNRVERLRECLAVCQQEDGRVCLKGDMFGIFWPTPLASLAWQSSERWQHARDRAVRFLIATSGRHSKHRSGSPTAHDPSLRGWPWSEGTHSWVEPTSLSILALQGAGHGNHSRVQEGIAMLVDRQLPHGGWNYGNTLVFERELHPLPDTSGMALQALAGHVPADRVKASLDYLQGCVAGVGTPLSLGWGILGLSAWDHRPRNAEQLLSECLRHKASASYSTSELCLLLVALQARQGISAWMKNQTAIAEVEKEG